MHYGNRFGTLPLIAVALLCITREAFLVATSTNVHKVKPHLPHRYPLPTLCLQQNEPALFYPLAAVTELICVLLFLVPGLVPSRNELREAGVRDEAGKYIRNGVVGQVLQGSQGRRGRSGRAYYDGDPRIPLSAV